MKVLTVLIILAMAVTASRNRPGTIRLSGVAMPPGTTLLRARIEFGPQAASHHA